MNDNVIAKNILAPNAVGYASFLNKKCHEFIRIADSGYGLYWFAQSFYLYWKQINKSNQLELWGNMGPHYISNRVLQFSEVSVNQDSDPDILHAEYRSYIFLLFAWVRASYCVNISHVNVSQ